VGPLGDFLETIVKYIKHISKQEIYFKEKKINIHVYFMLQSKSELMVVEQFVYLLILAQSEHSWARLNAMNHIF
jgi:hypothetical protein